MKLWDKGLPTAEAVHRFTVGNDREMDRRLAPFDIQGTKAHVTMLASCGLLPADELPGLIKALETLEAEAIHSDFAIPVELEDIHSWVEYRLVELVGESGKKVHTARSRNDQVLVDIHLYLKATLDAFESRVKDLGNRLCDLALEHQKTGLPGYTHTQVAMPSSFGMWFSAYAECLADDLLLLGAAKSCADQNPLGTAAGYGSVFPIDREQTTQLLGFSGIKYNPIAAQLNRGKLENTVCFALGSVSATLGKLASDSVLYLCQNFDFIAFPDELTTGSSIMPHKKNPDVFELIRAKCNQVSAATTEIQALTRNLTSGYHRDFQLLKEPLFRAIDLTSDCLEMTLYMLEHIRVRENLLDEARYSVVYSVDAISTYVNEGMPFRDAYVKVGQEIAEGRVLSGNDISTTHSGSLDNLCVEQIRQKLN